MTARDELTWPFVRSINRIVESRLATRTESFGLVGETMTLVTGAALPSHASVQKRAQGNQQGKGGKARLTADGVAY